MDVLEGAKDWFGKEIRNRLNPDEIIMKWAAFDLLLNTFTDALEDDVGRDEGQVQVHQVGLPTNNRSQYMRDGNLWGAYKLSRGIIIVKPIFMWHQLIDSHQTYTGSLAILTSRNTNKAYRYIVFLTKIYSASRQQSGKPYYSTSGYKHIVGGKDTLNGDLAAHKDSALKQGDADPKFMGPFLNQVLMPINTTFNEPPN